MDEKYLIGRCIGKDDAAWRKFLDLYGSCIYGSIVRVLGKFSVYEPGIAEDIFAGVIEKLLSNNCRALRGFKWNSKFSTWLISIARNKTYDYLRGQKRKPTISLSAPIDDGQVEMERLIALDLDLDHDLEVHLTTDEVLAMLPTKDRLVLKLYYLEGMKEREIGELLDLSVDAVSARKSRALKKLRNMVRKDKP